MGQTEKKGSAEDAQGGRMVGEDCGREERALEEEGRAILEMRQKVRGEKVGCACSQKRACLQ